MATDNTAKNSAGHLVVRSTQETALVAAELLPVMLGAGTVSLEGPLGAGKTHCVKAVAAALGLTEDVTSPTFTLLQSYGTGSARLHHSDWYRLESAAEAQALGLEEYEGDGLMFIEWGDKFPELLSPQTLRIRFEPQADDARLISWKSLKTPNTP